MTENSTPWTEGPWGLDTQLEPNGACLSRGVMTTKTFIADVHLDDEDDAEAEANARLIAAAPDLYAALVETTALLRDYVHACGGIYDERDSKVLGEATAALRRALPPTDAEGV